MYIYICMCVCVYNDKKVRYLQQAVIFGRTKAQPRLYVCVRIYVYVYNNTSSRSKTVQYLLQAVIFG